MEAHTPLVVPYSQRITSRKQKHNVSTAKKGRGMHLQQGQQLGDVVLGRHCVNDAVKGIGNSLRTYTIKWIYINLQIKTMPS